jgi:SAM-dependent methyltransferase
VGNVPEQTRRDVVQVRAGNGEPHPVLYWEEAGALYFLPSSTATRWLHDALKEGGCTVQWSDGRTAACSAELFADPDEATRIRARFREKYGGAVYDLYFGPRAKIVRLILGGRVTRRTATDLLEQEFDAVAAGYLDTVHANRIELYVKEATRQRLLDAFPAHERLLEIGAGTGFETVPILRAGHSVDVVDLSPRMLEELTARAAEAGVGDGLRCRPGRLSQLEEVLRDLPDRAFGGAYSTFGAFNLEGELGSAPATFARVLPRGARLVFTSLNRPGALPVLWELTIGNRTGAFRRARTEMPPGTVRYPLTVYPRNPSWWDRALAPHFVRVATLPVSVTAPPFESPRLVRWLGHSGGRRARRWDAWLSGRPLLTPFGEWSFLTYERVGRPSPP